ncbi:MAG: T9SS type A sorting domain-containing protein [candidate division Zixibacteria bacterium]|nr:T9SS type A sorting domain-containing protein [candidate division Zixibacteria bacterium]
MDSLAREYPDLFYMDILGYGTEYGEPIWYMKISDNPEIDEDEPAILLHGCMHADEILSTEVLMHYLKDFSRRYNENDPRVLNWARGLEIYVIPILNVEGHKVVEDGITWWRKTCRDNNLNGVFDTLMDGVDLNRNFSLGWSGGPADTSDFFYRGPWPFSESEAQAIRELSYRKKFIIAIDYHSPTYGRPEVVYYSWNRSEMGGLAVDHKMLLDAAHNFATSILKDDGINPYDYSQSSAGNGYHRMWQYNRFAAIAFTCEISDTTIQDTSMVDMICEHHIPGIEYLMDRALGTGLNGLVTDAETGEPVWAEVKILQAYHPNMARRFTIPETGRYRRLLLPGIYTLEVEADGYRTKRFYNLTVHGDGSTIFNVEMEPGRLYTGVDEIYLPDGLALKQNYPNPFNARTTIEYTVGPADYSEILKREFPVNLAVYNLQGHKVTELINNIQHPGTYSITWDAKDRHGNPLSTGVYFYRLEVGNSPNRIETRKMLLVK